MRDRRRSVAGRAAAGAVPLLLLALAFLLGFAVSSLPGAAGLEDDVRATLERSGVDSAVTAVLLNFRGYDTLLELAVLFGALLGVWSCARMPAWRPEAPGLVLRFLAQVLVPFLILFAAYLLWAGTSEAGGAFQAGAVVAAAGVLVMLTGGPAPHALPRPLHLALIALGLGTFIAVGVGTLALGGGFLELPPAYAQPLILLIEAAATVSIGLALLGVFEGGRPPAARGGERR